MQHHFRRLFMLALTGVALPSLVRAQDTTAVGVYCPVHQRTYACRGSADCDRRWARHLEEEHRDGGNGPSRGPVASFNLRVNPGRAAFKAIVLGGFSGALAGSLFAGPDPDTRQEAAGALVVAGSMFSAAAITNRSTWSRAAAAAHGALGGGALGGGIGKAMERSPRGSEERKVEQDRTAAAAVQGAGVGTAAGFFLPSITKRVAAGLPPHSPWRRLRVESRPTYLGLRWTW